MRSHAPHTFFFLFFLQTLGIWPSRHERDERAATPGDILYGGTVAICTAMSPAAEQFPIGRYRFIVPA